MAAGGDREAEADESEAGLGRRLSSTPFPGGPSLHPCRPKWGPMTESPLLLMRLHLLATRSPSRSSP